MTRQQHPSNGGAPRLTVVPTLTVVPDLEVGDRPIDRLLVHLACTHETLPHIAELVRRVGYAHRVGELQPWLVTASSRLMVATSCLFATHPEAVAASEVWAAHEWTGITILNLGAIANDLDLQILDGRVVE